MVASNQVLLARYESALCVTSGRELKDSESSRSLFTRINLALSERFILDSWKPFSDYLMLIDVHCHNARGKRFRILLRGGAFR